jgi:hypothetical protein
VLRIQDCGGGDGPKRLTVVRSRGGTHYCQDGGREGQSSGPDTLCAAAAGRPHSPKLSGFPSCWKNRYKKVYRMPRIDLEDHGERAESSDVLQQVPPEGQRMWSFKDVFRAEYRDLFRRNKNLPGGEPNDQIPTVANGLTGIALSGGGIRSASFSLGVLGNKRCRYS